MKTPLKMQNSVMISARKLFLDPDDVKAGRQRDPLDRLLWLAKKFGEDGEKFHPDKFGTVVVKARPNGRYAIKEGGGRHYAVMHLLKQPDLEIPCQIVKGDDLEIFEGQNDRVLVPKGLLYWGRGMEPRNKLEYGLCEILRETREGFTTVPGKRNSVNVNHAIFAYDLGVLGKVVTYADRFDWRKPSGLEGIGMTGLAGFFFLYPVHDATRLETVLSAASYEEIKDASRQFLPKNKEHGRQKSVAITKELVTRYNLTRSVVKLNSDLIPTLQEKVQHLPRFKFFVDVWEMRKVIETKQAKKRRKRTA